MNWNFKTNCVETENLGRLFKLNLNKALTGLSQSKKN